MGKGRYSSSLLLPAYNKGDGYTFHKNFSKLNLQSEHAKNISFVELLNIPTTGMSTKDKEQYLSLINLDYLKELETIIFDGREKIVFIPKSVYRFIKMLSHKYGIFNNLLEPENTTGQEFINIHNKNNIFIFVCNHFSACNFNSFYENMSLIVQSFLSDIKKNISWEVSYVGSKHGERIEKKCFIEAADVIEVKKILCEYTNLLTVEYDLKQLNFCPILSQV